MKGAVLEDNLALADDHQRGATALHAFEDVVLERLEERVGEFRAHTPPSSETPSAWQRPPPNTTRTKERPRDRVPVLTGNQKPLHVCLNSSV